MSLRPARGPDGARRRPRTIALVGVDGSGKTTQAHRLAAALSAAGLPAMYWQNAGGRRWFGRLARRLGRRDAQRLLGRCGLLVAESGLRWLAIARALIRSRLSGRIAVMDRYAACQHVSVRAHGGPPWLWRLVRYAFALFPRPDLTLLLTVDPGEAYQRIEDRGTDHETLDYLAAAATAYRELPEYPDFVLVDAGRPRDEVTGAILSHLRRPARLGPPADQPAGAHRPIAAPRRARTALPTPR